MFDFASESDPDINRAHDKALNFLSFRPRSCTEISRYLAQKGFSTETADAVLQRLQTAQLVDDAEFAAYWIANRAQFSPRGRRALWQELRQKGIARDVIETALADRNDELGQAVAAGRRKLRAFEKLDEREFEARMVAFLQRRGFSYGDARSAADILRVSDGDKSPE